MQAADVAHKAEVSELNKTIQRGEGRLQEQEGEIKKLTESAEAIKQNTLKTQDELRKNLERKEMELKEVQGEVAELLSENARLNELADKLQERFVPDTNECETLDLSAGAADEDTGQPAASVSTCQWVRKEEHDQLLARYKLVRDVMEAAEKMEA